MRAEWRRRGLLAAAAWLAAGAPDVSQQPQAAACTVALGRGATTPGGATGTMTVRNVGEPCRIANFTVPESRVATSRLEVVKAPTQGRLDIVQPPTGAVARVGRARSCRSTYASRCRC